MFHAPWEKILQSVEATAHSHHLLSTRIEKDVETPLRTFQNKGDMQNMNATAGNLASMARDLEDAQKKVEALQKKGGKGTAQKLDAASTKLTVAQQQWDSSAPFIFESLQAIDEQRINQLRDLLTQYQTHENDGAQRAQSNAVETLAAMLEVSTELEIASFKEKVIAGTPKLERRTSTRQSSNVGGSALAPPNSIPEDTMSEHSGPASESRQESFASEPKPQAKPEKTGKFGARSCPRSILTQTQNPNFEAKLVRCLVVEDKVSMDLVTCHPPRLRLPFRGRAAATVGLVFLREPRPATLARPITACPPSPRPRIRQPHLHGMRRRLKMARMAHRMHRSPPSRERLRRSTAAT